MTQYHLLMISLFSLFYLPIQLHCMEAGQSSILTDFESTINEHNTPFVQSLEHLLEELKTKKPASFALNKNMLLTDPTVRFISKKIFEDPDHYAALRKAIEATTPLCNESYARENILPHWHNARITLLHCAKKYKKQNQHTGTATHCVLSALHLAHLRQLYPVFQEGEEAVKKALTVPTTNQSAIDTRIIPQPQLFYRILLSFISCTIFSWI